MVLADLGPLRLGHDHAHEIVRLRIGRRDPHRIARVKFGLRQRALGEQQKRQRLGHGQIVGIEPHDPLEQRLRRRRPVLASAKPVKQSERAAVLRRALQNLNEQPLGFDLVARRERRPGSADFGRRSGLRPRRRPVEPTAAILPQTVAARTGRRWIDRLGRRHARKP